MSLRKLIIYSIILFTIIFEISFISSLPYPFNLLPPVLVLCVFLLQNRSSMNGALGLIAYGFFQDIYQLRDIPFQTLFYGALALVGFLLSNRYFNSHTIYGFVGCSTIIFLLEIPLWNWFADYGQIAWRYVFLIVLIVIVFYAYNKKGVRLLIGGS